MQNVTNTLLIIFCKEKFKDSSCLLFCWIRGIYTKITWGGPAVQARTRLGYQV